MFFRYLKKKITVMKELKKIGLLLLFTVSALNVSCNDDDDEMGPIIPGTPTGTDIRYEVSASSAMIQSIGYKKGNGDAGIGVMGEEPTYWTTTIIAPFSSQSFVATCSVVFLNTSDTEQNYTLKIFKNGTEVQSTTGIVPMADDNPLTDDTVTAGIQTVVVSP